MWYSPPLPALARCRAPARMVSRHRPRRAARLERVLSVRVARGGCTLTHVLARRHPGSLARPLSRVVLTRHKAPPQRMQQRGKASFHEEDAPPEPRCHRDQHTSTTAPTHKHHRTSAHVTSTTWPGSHRAFSPCSANLYRATVPPHTAHRTPHTPRPTPHTSHTRPPTPHTTAARHERGDRRQRHTRMVRLACLAMLLGFV